MLHPAAGIDFIYINRSGPLAGLRKSFISYSTVADYTETSIDIADIIDLSSDSITIADSIEEPTPQRNKRRRLDTKTPPFPMASVAYRYCRNCVALYLSLRWMQENAPRP